MQTALYTYSDAQSHLLDWCGPSSTDMITLRKVRRAVEASYREIANIRRWSYFMTRGRLNTVANYNTGTITYTNSTRAIDLAGGTFPSWAAFGTISISGVEYPVVQSNSSTQVLLSVNSNPGADVAAGTSYNLWRDTFPLPVDCVEVGTIKDATRNITLSYIEPNDFVAMRLTNSTASVPYYFTITADPHYVGTMAIRMYPPPGAVYQYDFMYHKRPRPLYTPSYTTGSITSSGTTVTGSGTTWTSAMVGCVLRNSANNTALPTGTEGSNPYVNQRIVTAFTSATSVTVDQAFDSDISSAAKYEISDPIDVEAGAMYSAVLRKCELELGVLQRRSDLAALQQNYYFALNSAMEADNRNLDRKPEATRYWRRVPIYYDITNATG